MKFHQLPIGNRFLYQGHVYCKTSPLAASGEGVGQRMIPRSAMVSPVDDSSSTGGAAGEPAQLPEAILRYHTQCCSLLEQAAARMPEIERLALLKSLDDSYREMTGALRTAD